MSAVRSRFTIPLTGVAAIDKANVAWECFLKLYWDHCVSMDALAEDVPHLVRDLIFNAHIGAANRKMVQMVDGLFREYDRQMSALRAEETLFNPTLETVV